MCFLLVVKYKLLIGDSRLCIKIGLYVNNKNLKIDLYKGDCYGYIYFCILKVFVYVF